MPLPPSFDHMNTQHWAMLSKKFERWLVGTLYVSQEESAWGLEAFCLSFISAYPLFPDGNWLPWDPRIPLEGHFIVGWMYDPVCRSNDGPINGPLYDTAVFLERASTFIWRAFHEHAARRFPPSPLLISST
ncbi:hypothetical protein JVU11DRAFT_10883 [Chiua virens]|nr:hypothetical protein JVU11DRAFT_10883 [Chiua virens]